MNSNLNSKGSLIVKEKSQISPLSRKFEFSALFSKQIFQIFCSGDRFTPFFGNGTKVKIASKIKPPLKRRHLGINMNC